MCAELRTGCVIRFPYLRVREAERGETEGRKHRPVAVGVRIARPKGDDVLVLFPITSQPPSDRFAVEIPEMEKRRSGLDVRLRLWIILDEYNQDVIGQSFYLEPEPPLGHFSKAFFLPLMKQFIARRARLSVAAFFDGPLSKDFDGLPTSASRVLYGDWEAEVGSAASSGEMVAVVGFDDASG